jgi:phospholipid/cholesterol/gamma-HCH transport system permease protein
VPGTAVMAPVARVGFRVRRFFEEVSNLARFSLRTTASLPGFFSAGIDASVKVVMRQVLFTGVQALPFVAGISLLVGAIVVVQSLSQLARFGAEGLVGKIFVVAVVRELGPLLTAIVVIGRSGTAIAAELATNRVSGEIDALEIMGIDPYHYVVVPRVAATVIALFGLTVFFDLGAVLGVFAMAALKITLPISVFLRYVLGALSATDLYISAGKSVVFGLAIAILCSYHGLAVRPTPTEIPRAVTRAVVRAIGVVFLTSSVISLVFYL